MKIATGLLFVVGVSSAAALEYEKDILPILSSKCFRCHGDGEKKGRLSLELEDISRVIGRGKAVVPGDSAKSDLYKLVMLPEDDEDVMPPEGKGRPLSDAEKEKLKEWIDGGALVGDEKPEEEMVAAKKKEPLTGDWTNREGKVISATLTEVDGDVAVLKLANGRIYRYEIGKLSDESQAKVREWAGDVEGAP